MRRLLKQENKMNYNSRESSSKMSKKKKIKTNKPPAYFFSGVIC